MFSIIIALIIISFSKNKNITKPLYTDYKKLIEILLENGAEPITASAIMSIIEHETNFNTLLIPESHLKKLNKMTPEEYIIKTEKNEYKNFINDKIPFGLGQWNYPLTKEFLLKYCKKKKLSLKSIECQIGFLIYRYYGAKENFWRDVLYEMNHPGFEKNIRGVVRTVYGILFPDIKKNTNWTLIDILTNRTNEYCVSSQKNCSVNFS